MKNFAKNITNRWWLLVLQGILAIAFGVVAWVWPGLTVLTLVILFGAYAFAGGVMSLFAAGGARREGDSPWPFILQGLLGIATGILVAVWPDISALSLLFVIAGFAIASGIFEVVSAIELRKSIDNEWFLALAGIASIGFGVLHGHLPRRRGGGARLDDRRLRGRRRHLPHRARVPAPRLGPKAHFGDGVGRAVAPGARDRRAVAATAVH